ncbi:TPA: IS1380-like element ISEcp1 family transposase, partial [Klebsiella pneumoniae]
MINKIDFKAKNLTSNAGLFLLLENAKSNGIFDFIENDLVFDNDSTNKIKMNHIKTMLCGHFIGIDKLERLKLLQNDPLVNEFDISVKEPETVSRFLGNFNFKTTQMFRDINFKVFKKLLTKSKLTSITIDIDSSVINVEGHQEGASKGYNPKKLGNRCYNIQFAFCDELKAYVTGFVRSGNTYTANGAAEMIKEIVANIKSDDLEILFRMDSGYFDEKIIETIESLGCKYLIKAKSYSTLTSQATNSSIVFVKGEEGRETTELYTKLVKWEKDRRFVVSRVLKPEKERAQLSL